MWFQRLSTHTLFLGSKCCFLPRIIHPMCNRFPFKSLMFTGGVFLDVLLYYNQKVAEFSKILKLFIHAHLLTRDDVRWYFPGLCGVSETTMWHSRKASVITLPHVSLSTKGDDSAKMVPVRSCYWWTCFGPFRSIATSSFDRISHEANISMEAVVVRIVFLSAVSSGFTLGTKAPWFLYHLL